MSQAIRDDQARRARRIAIGAGVGYFLLSAWILARRNLYDDELGSFTRIDLPWSHVWGVANRSDVHPPGMYLLAKAAYALIPHERWAVLIPIALVALGLAFFLGRTLRALDLRGPTGVLAAAGCAFAPQFLLWTNSLRWYSWWTAGALVVCGCVLHARDDGAPGPATPRTARSAIAVGLSLAALLYLTYLTLPFFVALALADLGSRPRGAGRATRARIWLLAGAVVLLTGLPQLWVLASVHLANSAAQRDSPLPAAIRLGYGVFAGEAHQPWHPSAIAGAAVLFPATVLGVVTSWRDPRWRPTAVFSTLMLALAAVSGLGIKPRTFVLLSPFIVLLAIRGITAPPWTPRARTAAVALFTVALLISTATGTRNLLLRNGLGKSGLNDRAEQVPLAVARLIEQFCAGGACDAVVFTRDRGASYALCLARTNDTRLHVVSFQAGVPARLACPLDASDIPRGRARTAGPMVAVLVESYLGSERARAGEIDAFHDLFDALAARTAHDVPVSPDTDAPMKRHLARLFPESADLPDDRFVLHAATMSLKAIDQLVDRWIHLPRGASRRSARAVQ